MASKTFIDEFIVGHNECRKMHGSPPVVHNSELSLIASKRANTMAANNRVESNETKYKNGKIGEIIVKLPISDNKELNGLDISKKWYNQIKDFKFNKPEINSMTENFTQLIWKNSKEVGVGVGISPNGYYFLVANYYPAGNIPNKIKENVPNYV